MDHSDVVAIGGDHEVDQRVATVIVAAGGKLLAGVVEQQKLPSSIESSSWASTSSTIAARLSPRSESGQCFRCRSRR